MYFPRLLLIGLMLTVTSLAIAKNKLVYYGPIITELKGVILERTDPGPPNYYDIKKGDLPETYGYLILKPPVDVDLKPNVEDTSGGFNELERNVHIIQLSVQDDKQWALIKTGKQVRVVGKLFHSFTGHHHEKVLMLIDKISELKAPIKNTAKQSRTRPT